MAPSCDRDCGGCGGCGGRACGLHCDRGASGIEAVSASEFLRIDAVRSIDADSRIAVSFWASSDGSPDAGAVRIEVGGAVPYVVVLPGGTRDWTRFEVAWTVPPRITAAAIVITASGQTSGIRIDSQLDQKIGDIAALGVRSARTDADWAGRSSRASTTSPVLTRSSLHSPVLESARSSSRITGTGSTTGDAPRVRRWVSPHTPVSRQPRSEQRGPPQPSRARISPGLACSRTGCRDSWPQAGAAMEALDLHTSVQPDRPDVLEEQLTRSGQR